MKLKVYDTKSHGKCKPNSQTQPFPVGLFSEDSYDNDWH